MFQCFQKIKKAIESRRLEEKDKTGKKESRLEFILRDKICGLAIYPLVTTLLFKVPMSIYLPDGLCVLCLSKYIHVDHLKHTKGLLYNNDEAVTNEIDEQIE